MRGLRGPKVDGGDQNLKKIWVRLSFKRAKNMSNGVD